MASKDAKVLRPGSALGTTSGHGRAAAIRMPMLRVSNFVDASSSLPQDQMGRELLGATRSWSWFFRLLRITGLEEDTEEEEEEEEEEEHESGTGRSWRSWRLRRTS